MLDRLLPLPIKKLAVAALPKLALPDEILPVTPRLVNVPTEVMFGCAAVVTVAAVVAAPLSAPVNVVALTLPALTLPVTVNAVNVPTEVMFG